MVSSEVLGERGSRSSQWAGKTQRGGDPRTPQWDISALHMAIGAIYETGAFNGSMVGKVILPDGTIIGGETKTPNGIEEGKWLYFIDPIEDILLYWGRVRKGDPCLVLYPGNRKDLGFIMRVQDTRKEINPEMVKPSSKGLFELLTAVV